MEINNMEPVTSTAIVATLVMCAQGVPIDGKCPDGSPPTEHTINILQTTSSKRDSLLEYHRDGKQIFRLLFDGSMDASPDFQPDANAMIFWHAVAASLEDAAKRHEVLQPWLPKDSR